MSTAGIRSPRKTTYDIPVELPGVGCNVQACTRTRAHGSDGDSATHHCLQPSEKEAKCTLHAPEYPCLTPNYQFKRNIRLPTATSSTCTRS
jgi:hypothetical protein